LAPSTFNTLEDTATRSRFVTLEETHIYSPQLIGKAHFSFNRTRPISNFVLREGFDFPGPLYFAQFEDVLGGVGITGLSSWGGGRTNPRDVVLNKFEYKKEFHFSSGRHSFKFGGEAERQRFNYRGDSGAGGQYAFSGPSDFLINNAASFLFTRVGSDSYRGWRQTLFGLYLQDDINVRPGFTLNLGLRYEFITSPYEVNGKVSNIRDLTPAHVNTVTEKGVDVGDPYFRNPSLKNFAPRVGFAWDVFQSGKTSFRGGIGLFHAQLMPNMYLTSGGRMTPFFSVMNVFARDLPVPFDFPNAFNTQSALMQNSGAPEANIIDYYMKQPKVYKWSLDVQQQVAPDTTLDVGYSGTRGLHLFRGAINLNSTPSEFRDGRRYILIQQPVNNPNWGRFRVRITDGTSHYHALRMSLTKRFSRGFQLQSSYTFSKSTDDSSTFTGSGDWGSEAPNYRAEKWHALSAFDVRNSFTTNFVYELPGSNLQGAAGKLLGGWGLSSILRFNDGHPMTLNAAQPRQGSLQMVFVDGSTVDLVPGGNQNPVSPQNPDQYFDATQFSFPEPFFQGNLGRGTVISPGVANIDFSLKKNTSMGWLGEAGNLEFRTEFFNLFNRPNFGTPALSLFDRFGIRTANAGQITSTRTSSRQIQFALRLVF
jgi:hypothetical protein